MMLLLAACIPTLVLHCIVFYYQRQRQIKHLAMLEHSIGWSDAADCILNGVPVGEIMPLLLRCGERSIDYIGGALERVKLARRILNKE